MASLAVKKALEPVDSVFQWLLFMLGIIQATLFQFITWIFPLSAENLYQVTSFMGLFTIPLIVITIIWIYCINISKLTLALFFRLLSWSGGTSMLVNFLGIFFYFIIFSVPTFNILTKEIVFLSIYLPLITLVPYLTIIKIAEKYKDIAHIQKYWQYPKNILVPFGIGLLIAVIPILFFIYYYTR